MAPVKEGVKSDGIRAARLKPQGKRSIGRGYRNNRENRDVGK